MLTLRYVHMLIIHVLCSGRVIEIPSTVEEVEFWGPDITAPACVAILYNHLILASLKTIESFGPGNLDIIPCGLRRTVSALLKSDRAIQRGCSLPFKIVE